MKFVVFIAETYVQLVITNLRAILPARLDRLRWACALDCVLLRTDSTVCVSGTVLYDAFYSYLCRRYWNGILGLSSPPLPGESFDTCSKAVAFTLADTQVFLTG